MIQEYVHADRRKKPRAEQIKEHEIAPEQEVEELRQAGFEILERRDAFIQRKPGPPVVIWLMVARPSVPASP